MKKKLILFGLAVLLALSVLTLVSGCAETAATAELYAYNLVFGNQVYIEYAVKVEGAGTPALSDVGVLIWREGTEERTPKTAVADLKAFKTETVGGTDCYVLKYTDLGAKEMTDKVYSQPYVKYRGATTYGEMTEYSVCTYAERKLGLVEGVAGTTDPNLIATIRDMLHYGASSQLYFNYKTDKLATYLLENRINMTYEGLEDAPSPNPAAFELASGKVKLLAPTKRGYTFLRWCDEEWNEITEIDTATARDITVHAVWSLNSYSITYKNTMGVFHDNDDTFTVMDAITPRPLEKYDYTFNGWRLGGPYGERMGENGIAAGMAENIILYADWTLKPDFENLLYVVDDEYNLPNGQKFCMLTGVPDNTVTKVEVSPLFNHIKEGALKDCHRLTELTLPYLGSDYTTSNYTNVGYLFGYASNAEAEGAIPTSLRKLTVTGGVIGDYAFANLKNVAEIVLSPEVTSIGYKAFLNCANLEDLTMPLLYVNYNTMQDARNSCQGYYYGLPGSVDDYHDDYNGKTFRLHINGGGIYYGAGNDKNWEHAGTILGKGFGGRIFQLCKGIGEVTIDNITVIPQFAFKECTNLKKVTIGGAVQNIMAGAFADSGIEEIVIPDSVKEIGEYWLAEWSDGATFRYFGYSTSSGNVFLNCQNLKRVVIGNGVENIPAYMFADCTGLEEVTIGENVRFVDNRAFYNCNDTFKVINNSKHKEWVISGPVSGRFMNQLMASANAPVKVYYGNGKFDEQIVDGFTEAQMKDWHIVFYSPTDPYAESGGNSNLEYWYHEDGAKWYENRYTVTPKTWEKPNA